MITILDVDEDDVTDGQVTCSTPVSRKSINSSALNSSL